MNPDLIKVTEIFLVPSSFLVAALGTADTNFHRAAVSFVGLVISVLWQVCSREALAEMTPSRPAASGPPHPRRTQIMAWLPVVFIVGWLMSVVVHAWLWRVPLHV